MKSITQDYQRAGVYCIYNKRTNEEYIGSSKNVYQRLLKHRAYWRKGIH